jgi:hypothetical protein
MTTHKPGIRRCLLALIEREHCGLPAIAAAAEAISADARFNHWFANTAKAQISEGRALELLALYNEIVAQCDFAVARFESNNDTAELTVN